MKKLNFFVTFGIAGISCCAIPLVTIASCGGQKQVTITNIEASAKHNNVSIGETITKQDIDVFAIYSDGTKKQVEKNDWECDDIGIYGYYFIKEESKQFNIRYMSWSTSVVITSHKGDQWIEADQHGIFLTKASSFYTCCSLKIWTVDAKTHVKTLADNSLFNIESDNENIAKYNSETQTIDAQTTAGQTIISFVNKQKPELKGSYIVTVQYIGDAMILNAVLNQAQDGVNVTLCSGQGNVLVPFDNNVCAVPEFAVLKGSTTHLPVTGVVGLNASTIETIGTLVLPSTVKSLSDNLFAQPNCCLSQIIYKGSKEKWTEVEKGVDWCGPFPLTVKCITTTTEEVAIPNRFETIFDDNQKILRLNEKIGKKNEEIKYVVRLDPSKIVPSTLIENMNRIKVVNDNTSAQIGLSGIYCDCTQLKLKTESVTREYYECSNPSPGVNLYSFSEDILFKMQQASKFTLVFTVPTDCEKTIDVQMINYTQSI